MGGKEAIFELQKLDPNVIAIVASGYSNNEVMAKYKQFGFKAWIKKPYQIEELSEVAKESYTSHLRKKKEILGENLIKLKKYTVLA